MKILVTRPALDGAETARQLAALGHQALLAPLLDVRFFAGPQIALSDVQAILATSANGIRALARRTSERDRPVFAVGPQTAAEAQALGFTDVRHADGDANDLARAVRGWTAPDKGALLQVAGEGNEAKLAADLSEFTVRREILYAVGPVESLALEAVQALQDGSLDAALFYSPRSAQVFCDRVQARRLPVTGVQALCISAATAAALAPLAFAAVRVAQKPNQAALLALLQP